MTSLEHGACAVISLAAVGPVGLAPAGPPALSGGPARDERGDKIRRTS